MENKIFFHLTSWSRETLVRTDWCSKTPSCVSGKLKCICTSAGCVLWHMSFVTSVSLPDALVFRVLGDLRTARWEAGMRLLVGSINAAAASISAVGWQKDTAPHGESFMRVEPLPLGLYASSWQNPKDSTGKPPVCYVRSKEGPLSAVVWCWRCL